MVLLEALHAEGTDVILLRSVGRVEVQQSDEGQSQPQLQAVCSIVNAMDKMRLSRSLYVRAPQVSLPCY